MGGKPSVVLSGQRQTGTLCYSCVCGEGTFPISVTKCQTGSDARRKDLRFAHNPIRPGRCGCSYRCLSLLVHILGDQEAKNERRLSYHCPQVGPTPEVCHLLRVMAPHGVFEHTNHNMV